MQKARKAMVEERKVTRSIVDFISTADIRHFPEEAIRLGKRCLIDGIGLVLAGSTAGCSILLRDHIRSIAGKPESTILGKEALKAPARLAALANGTSGHAHDFDDTQLSRSPDRIYGLLTHPTIPPLAAGLAVAEKFPLSGVQFLEAFLTGFEVECKIAEAIDPSHYKKGFHTSGTIGTFGAAACAAKLLNLKADQIGRAIAIAASCAGGIRVNFGTMTKPLHVGRAAENGLVAADLASRGFTADAEGLDGPWGFFQVFGGGFDSGKIINQMGNPHTIVDPGISIKPYPCGVLGHPSMDAMRKMVVDHDIKPEQITAVKLRAGSNILNPLRYRKARNELEAKFCLPFMLASIALRRKAGIQEFSDEFVASKSVQQMMDKVETIFDPGIEAQGFEKIRSVIEVYLADGRKIVQEADERYRGGPDHPFSREELHQKFTECAELVLPTVRIQKTLDLLESIENAKNLQELLQTLGPPD
jgi:2-methylcitrate dehydratase PrpD